LFYDIDSELSVKGIDFTMMLFYFIVCDCIWDGKNTLIINIGLDVGKKSRKNGSVV